MSKVKTKDDELHGVVKLTIGDHLINILIAIVFGILTIACIFTYL